MAGCKARCWRLRWGSCQALLVLLSVATLDRIASASGGPIITGVTTARPEARIEQPSDPMREWYGWQTLALDGASVSIVLLGGLALATDEYQLEEVGATWILGSAVPYLFGSPVLHAVRGHSGKAWASFGLRLGMPLAGYAAGAFPECHSGDFCKVGYGAVGGAIGIAGAMVIDAAWLAWERRSVRQSAGFRSGSIELTPKLVLSPDRGELMLVGRM